MANVGSSATASRYHLIASGIFPCFLYKARKTRRSEAPASSPACFPICGPRGRSTAVTLHRGPDPKIGKTNAVFPPWPIREFRDRSDGIPESGREDSIFRGGGAFLGAEEFKHGGVAYRAE